jgi:hypothetical protein
MEQEQKLIGPDRQPDHYWNSSTYANGWNLPRLQPLRPCHLPVHEAGTLVPASWQKQIGGTNPSSKGNNTEAGHEPYDPAPNLNSTATSFERSTMHLLMTKNHLDDLMIITICSAIACACALVCVYRCRSRQLFKLLAHQVEDRQGRFTESIKLSRKIRRVRTAFAGVPGGIAGGLCAYLCASLYYSAADQPHQTSTQLLAKAGWAVMAALALVVVARIIVYFAEYSDYNTLVAIAIWAGVIAATLIIGGILVFGLIQVFIYVSLPIIVIGVMALLGLLHLFVAITQARADAASARERTKGKASSLSSYHAEIRRREWMERQRIEWEENIRQDVRERRLRSPEY